LAADFFIIVHPITAAKIDRLLGLVVAQFKSDFPAHFQFNRLVNNAIGNE
jgi:hypothetical protein